MTSNPNLDMATRSADRPVFRFAPSPNGELHLGHAYSALLNADLSRQAGGRMLLRIEDIDTLRCRPEYETQIRDDLGWLGVTWDEPTRRQSQHFDNYAAALDRLESAGLVYRAFMTRGEVRAWIADHQASGAPWPHDPDGGVIYPPIDRSMDSRESAAKAALRLAAGHEDRAITAGKVPELARIRSTHRQDPNRQCNSGTLGRRDSRSQ